ncbi:hypothetical protein AMJ83_08515 [candidate division WOR_3 bacterium SM23_42]|uniref:Uncharacterized protein n=1 Tax=candidate division WOR_3 bacterium SM23_42 TaxID=1703779 RepID=A0A0S8FTJ1_UNCW3|nr:MAG: hypothetical protein AMJ83_08515 [candidate division WOR_3 bacterium SM23_42]
MLLSGILIIASLFQASENVEFSLGLNYSSYLLFQDTLEAKGKWNIGGEIGVDNVIPNIGLKYSTESLHQFQHLAISQGAVAPGICRDWFGHLLLAWAI